MPQRTVSVPVGDLDQPGGLGLIKVEPAVVDEIRKLLPLQHTVTVHIGDLEELPAVLDQRFL